VNQKLPFLTFSFTSENPWLMELAEHNGKVFPVGINAKVARERGIRDGDPVELETPWGRKVTAVVRLTEGIHPECLAVPGVLGRWVGGSHMKNKGVHFNSLVDFRIAKMDSVSAALDSCVRVRLTSLVSNGSPRGAGRSGVASTLKERVLARFGGRG
jgi:molybdopterin-containing oxidoreductase family molybdopterin binding subunit